MRVKIKKATGQLEDFDKNKLLNLLIRSGADPEHAGSGDRSDQPDKTSHEYEKDLLDCP